VAQKVKHYTKNHHKIVLKPSLSQDFLEIFNHTLALYCESVLKATKQVNRKGQNSTPRHTKTP